MENEKRQNCRSSKEHDSAINEENSILEKKNVGILISNPFKVKGERRVTHQRWWIGIYDVHTCVRSSCYIIMCTRLINISQGDHAKDKNSER